MDFKDFAKHVGLGMVKTAVLSNESLHEAERTFYVPEEGEPEADVRYHEKTIGEETGIPTGSDEGKDAISEAFRSMDHGFGEPVISKKASGAAFDDETSFETENRQTTSQSPVEKNQHSQETEDVWKDHDSQGSETDDALIDGGVSPGFGGNL